MLEIREVEPGGPIELRGHASTTEVPYRVGSFTETIKRGAFKRSLGENPDVSLLIDHQGLPLARTTSGTLRLSEDDIGLLVEAELEPSDPDVQAIVPKMRRGDLHEMSFAFRATKQDWNSNKTERILHSVTVHRGDVSIVSRAANPSATAGLRAENLTLEQREAVVERVGQRVCGPYSIPDFRTASVRQSEVVAEHVRLMPRSGVMRARANRSRLKGGERRSDKYDAATLRKMLKNGEAFANANGEPSYPIADAQDLSNAIRAVGRGNPSHEAIRRYIMRRAKALRLSRMVPQNWNSNGSLAQ